MMFEAFCLASPFLALGALWSIGHHAFGKPTAS